MSHFITCKPNNDGNIQAFFENTTKMTYELALVDIYYNISWMVSFGKIGFIFEQLLYEEEVECYDYSSYDVLQTAIDHLILKNKLKVKATIKYDYYKKQLFFESSSDAFEFVVGKELQEYFGLPVFTFKKMKIACLPRLEKVKLMNIYCEVIADQVVGQGKEKLLRICLMEEVNLLNLQEFDTMSAAAIKKRLCCYSKFGN